MAGIETDGEGPMAIDWANRVEIVTGDITVLDVDVIVNAANQSLLGGGGVDGAIHRAAGPGLLAECRLIGGCPTGSARLTGGHKLRARYVIHAVGPVYHSGRTGEPDLLRSCYRQSLELAAEKHATSIAFPCISTGIYQYPKPEACRIASDTVVTWLADNEHPGRVIFCCYDAVDAAIYETRLRDILEAG
jgi:O-acetyl-ADP-ribose deacetylase (regulator of RNase III)